MIVGVGAAGLLRDSAGRRVAWQVPTLFGLFAWQAVLGAMAHPVISPTPTKSHAQGHPENFVAESNLDGGGQHRVGDFLERDGRHRGHIHALQRDVHSGRGHTFPKVTFSDWYHASPGWNVVSLGGWKVYNHPGWIGSRQPQFRIGRHTGHGT